MDEDQELEKFTEVEFLCYGLAALGADVVLTAANFLSFGAATPFALFVKSLFFWRLEQLLKNKHSWLPSGVGQMILRFLGANLSFFFLFLIVGWLHNNKERVGTAAKALKAGRALKAAAGTKGLRSRIKAAREAYQTSELNV